MVSVPVLSQPGAANTRTISQPWKVGVPSALPSRAATTEPAVKSTPGRVTCAHSRWIRLPRVHGRFWMESESSQRKDLGQKHRARFRLYVKEPVPVCSRSGMRSKLYYVVNGKQRWRRHAVPKDPRTPAQQRSRARFAAASKTWSEDGLLTEAHRNAWYSDGAKRQSSSRLGSSGPLTGQQNYIGRNCTRKQRECEMLLHLRQSEQNKVKIKALRPELTAEASQYQPFTRATSGTRRACAGYAPSIRHARTGYARKCEVRQLMLQVPRIKRVTQSTSGRPQSNTRALPARYQWQAGSVR